MTQTPPEPFDFMDEPEPQGSAPAAPPHASRFSSRAAAADRAFSQAIGALERGLSRLPFWMSFHKGARRSARDPQAVRYGDVYARSLAAGIDVMALFFLFQAPFAVMTERLYARLDPVLFARVQEAGSAQEAWQHFWLSGAFYVWALNAVLQTLYLVLVIWVVQWNFHTTPGKWLLGLKIVDAKTLQAPSRWRYGVRLLGYILAGLPLMVGFFWMNFNKERRGWHDLVAGTVVIQTRPHGWMQEKLKQCWSALLRWKRR